MIQVRVSRVSKIYGKVQPDSVKAVDDISLEIHPGEFFIFLGPSGCGKTTTLRMIAGLEQPTEGEIYLGNRLVNTVPPGQRNLAMAFEAYALYPPLNVYDNLAYGLQARGVSKKEIDQRVREICQLLEMEEILDRFPRNLSGGQQQLVSLARALVRGAPLLLLDEPLSHLEPARRFRVRTALKEFVTQGGMTTIYVTHDQVEAIALADRIAVMKRAVLQQVGTPAELWNEPVNKFVAGFIGEPPMNFMSSDFYDDRALLPPSIASIATLESAGAEIGIRPQSLRIVDDTVESSPETFVFNAVVHTEQWLGHESQLFCRIGTTPIIVTLPPEAPLDLEAESRVRLAAPREKVYLFQEDGSRIKPRQKIAKTRSN
jgi:multiple sugar transport system ATP-binding protein